MHERKEKEEEEKKRSYSTNERGSGISVSSCEMAIKGDLFLSFPSFYLIQCFLIASI